MRESTVTRLFMIEKIKQRLGSWKANSLALVGRLTLTRSVLSSLPSYYMQTTCEDIDRICRNILWDQTAKNEKVLLLNF